MTRPVIDVRDLGIRHDGRARNTPDGLSFELYAGETVLLLGPSGCGKSTLALALNGLVPQAVPSRMSGRVVVGGTDTRDTPVARLSTRVGIVFQDPDSQIVTGTVLDEVCFGPENLRLPVETVLIRAEEALRRVGLWDRRHDNPDVLSGGGRQRLAVACALALETGVLVLDEPTANLDPAGVDDVYAILRDVAATGQHTIVLVEHNLDVALGVVDRVLVLDRDGRLAFDGPADEILREHMADLLALGVWLPAATLAALRLREAGVPLTPLPVTGDELTTALDTCPSLPPPIVPAPPEPDGTPFAVTVRDLTVVRGDRRILDRVSLDVPSGAFLAIVGANGAGKTTLLRAIAGVTPPPRGRVRLGDVDPAVADPNRLLQTVGFVFQNPEHQFVQDTVAAELTHGLRRLGLGAGEIEPRVAAMLDRLGLDDAREVHPFLLSGGQKRRLSVGTALIAGAPVLALDEPTFGQDRARAEELLDLLAVLNAAGATILIVTHDLQLVADHASHVAVLDAGRLTGMGTTAEILGSGLVPLPPFARAMRRLTRHPHWQQVNSVRELVAHR
ncbi:energy-coupling factor transporter ATPase [Verrucosispora sp. WMMD573]|uniref:ABC transporter ATP-binding protein n=1 Tax=Verrucosispora sp. WMMD573 TaxID=3015149 RepID=UPI00248C39D5|nr:energy-coupling factor transporter ATPase [Verrucosispora sp. WMMD573]WBB53803.1 energy-coupling factor transporter ATPase [Verrucosispora sp. WMMD573]